MGAELQRKDIISDEALEAPLILAKNMEKVYDVVMKIAKATENSPLGGVDEGLKKTSKETDDLTKQQQELAKVTKQIATINARNNAEYIKEVKALEAVKKALKDKTALGEKDAKAISASNASIKELNAALSKNKQAYEQLATAEQRSSKEGQELLKVIQAQDTELKGLKKTIGENQLNVGNYADATKNLKLQLKAAKDEMVGIAAASGMDSEEFKAAAEKAGELKNELGDIEAAANAVSGSKFENLGSSLGLVGQKVKALDFKGAGAAMRQFGTVAKSVTFKEMTAGAKALGKQMLVLAAQVLVNPLFWIPAILVAIGAGLVALRDSIPFMTKAFAAMGDAIGWVVQQGKDFLDWIGLTRFAADEKARAIIDGAEKEIEALEEAAERRLKVDKAAGKETLEQEIKLQKDIIAAARKGSEEILKQKEEYGEWHKKEDEALYAKLIKTQLDAQATIDELNAAHEKDKADKKKAADEKAAKLAEEAALREASTQHKLNTFILAEEAKRLEGIADNSQKEIDARIQASEDLDAVRTQLAETEYQRALLLAGDSIAGQVLAYEELEAQLSEIKQDGVNKRDGISKDAIEKDKQTNKTRIENEIAFWEAEANARNQALDQAERDIQKDIIAGYITREEGEKRLTALQKKHAEERIKIEINALRKILEIRGLGADKKAEIEAQLYKLEGELLTAQTDQVAVQDKRWIDKANEKFDKYAGLVTSNLSKVSEVSSMFTANRMEELDMQAEHNKELLDEALENEEHALEVRLRDATLSDKERAEIEKTSAERQDTLKLAAQRREEQIAAQKRKAVRKQAIIDKGIAIVMAQIDTASAIMKTAGTLGYPLAIPWIALAAALGIAQTAAIIAKPIPAAKKGIRSHQGGPILAGEAGAELVKMPGGRFALTDDVATVYDFPRGTDIIPHEETMRQLAQDGLRVSGARNYEVDGYGRLEKKLDKINSTIKNKREWNLTGSVTGYTDGGTRARYIESLRNRPR